MEMGGFGGGGGPWRWTWGPHFYLSPLLRRAANVIKHTEEHIIVFFGVTAAGTASASGGKNGEQGATLRCGRTKLHCYRNYSRLRWKGEVKNNVRSFATCCFVKSQDLRYYGLKSHGERAAGFGAFILQQQKWWRVIEQGHPVFLNSLSHSVEKAPYPFKF